MPDRAPTIIDVAARAGVSKSLVSMVMRADPGVSARRRDAVLAAAAELGYRPNRAAAILAGTRTRTIGVVVDDFRNPWFVPLLDGIRETLAPHGLRLTLADVRANAHLGSSPFDDLLSLRVDGVVLAAEGFPDLAAPSGTPVVVAGARGDVPSEFEVVASDEAAGGRLAVAHLVGAGHRHIVHVTGSGGPAAVRREAAVAEMVASGVAPLVSARVRPRRPPATRARVRRSRSTPRSPRCSPRTTSWRWARSPPSGRPGSGSPRTSRSSATTRPRSRPHHSCA